MTHAYIQEIDFAFDHLDGSVSFWLDILHDMGSVDILFIGLCRHGEIDIIKTLLVSDFRYIDINANNHAALAEAIIHDHIEIAMIIIDDVRNDVNSALLMLVSLRCPESLLVRLLSKTQLTTKNISLAFLSACVEGNIMMVELLMLHKRIQFSGNIAINSAISHGHKDIVELLIDHPEIYVSDNTLVRALLNRQYGVAEVLFQSPRVIITDRTILKISKHTDDNIKNKALMWIHTAMSARMPLLL